MNLSTSAKRLASLGHESRLAIFQSLVRAGPDGLTIGQLQEALDSPASTLSFHLRELVASDLVTQAREGRSVRCCANFRALDEVLSFVKKSCCGGVALSVFGKK